jgi:hypothetical protein
MSAAPGMPSEEETARALAETLRQKAIPDDIWHGVVESFRELEAKYPDYAEGFSLATDAFRQARAILALIRPAFEAKEREIDTYRTCADANESDRRGAEQEIARLKAKLAQAVEAGFREGWMTGNRDGIPKENPDRAWNKSKSNRLLRARTASAIGKGAEPTLATSKDTP